MNIADLPITEVRRRLQVFANTHKVVLQECGEVGFGRSCVGFLHGDSYVDYNPRKLDGEYDLIWPADPRLSAPKGVNAYHKHDCLAVLVRWDEDIDAPADAVYDAALRELLLWVEHLKAQGEIEIVDYDTGAVGIQALISGVRKRAIRFKASA